MGFDLLVRLDAVDRRALAVVEEGVEHCDEGVPHCVLRLNAALGVPHKTLGDEVNEKFIVAAENLGEGFSCRSSPASL